MEIRLAQLYYPACAEDVPCVLCGREFRLGVVVATVVTTENMGLGLGCPECALYLADGPMGQARPDAFPNLEEFSQRFEDWPEPRYASEREMREYLDDE